MRHAAVLAIGVVAVGVAAAAAAVIGARAPSTNSAINPVWTETKWPFLLDQWGIGKAFVCMPADCGVKVEVYVRPKIGFCNCSNGVYDDGELERVGDAALVGRDFGPLGPGHSIKVGWMYGRSRPYLATDDEGRERRLISVAFNDECDAVVALAMVGGGDPTAIEPPLIAFLNNRPLVLWVKKELGLEYVYREW
jgi:hypothetical protein